MSNEIKVPGEDMCISPLPVVQAIGLEEVHTAGTDVAAGINILVNTFLETAQHGDSVNVTVTSKFGNEIRHTEMELGTIPDVTPPPFVATVKNMGDNGEIVSTPLEMNFEPVPKATVKMVKIETSTPTYAAKLYDQLTTGFHFNEELYNPEFDKD